MIRREKIAQGRASKSAADRIYELLVSLLTWHQAERNKLPDPVPGLTKLIGRERRRHALTPPSDDTAAVSARSHQPRRAENLITRFSPKHEL